MVTGLGLCTPLGGCVDVVWRKLLQGQSGIRNLPDRPGFNVLPCQVAGFAPTDAVQSLEGYVGKAELRTMSKDSVHSLGVVMEALRDARWMPEDRTECDHLASGVSMGNGGTSSIVDYLEVGEMIAAGKYRKISPYLIPRLLPNMPAGNVSIQFKLKGPNHCVSTACSSGLHSIGDSTHMITRGACDVMVAGSADFSLNPIILAGFCRAKALATKFNREPQKASRPFDTRRDGFVPSEGAGAVILEELEHAQRRGAHIYAEIVGYGMSSDAHHITAPLEDGDGAVRAMAQALRDAELQPEAVGHVNAHATSTPIGDLAENNAIKRTFGNSSCDLPVYAPKGALGHLLGAAGTVEAIIAILSVQTGVIPPNVNLEAKSEEFSLNYVTGGPLEWGGKSGGPRVAVTNSFGFGGTNASICIRQYDGNNV